MTMFIMGPNGTVKLDETPVPPCPECGGAATSLTQHHKMSCGWSYILCGCGEWVFGKSPHQCKLNHCDSCLGWYEGESHYCSAADGSKIHLVKKPRRIGPPSAVNLFDIPPRPRPNRWFIDWRWKRKVWELLTAESTQKFGNEWHRHTASGATGHPTRRIAVNAVAALRRKLPGKSFRVVSRHV